MENQKGEEARSSKLLIHLMLAIALFLLSACGSRTQSVTGNYVGQVEGSNAFIGLVTNGEQVMAFYCDGTTEAAPVLWGWFNGELNGDAFDLTNEAGDRLSGAFESEGASGTITLADGTALTFQSAPVSQPSGLYRNVETTDGVETVSGWIVLTNGELRGGRSGAQLAAAPGGPVGWIDPDSQPSRWINPDPEL